MNKKPTVTIGIPAFNEERNIEFLLKDLLNQEAKYYELHEIIVASDNSTDNTDEIVKNFNKNKIRLIANTVREGQSKKQNQIIEQCDTDVLVLLNADILVHGNSFIDNLIYPVINGADLTCGPLHEIEPQTLIENILTLGSKYRRDVFAKFNYGHNLFTCHGSHRAFSKRFYKEFRFGNSVGEDAFSYLSCVSKGYTYNYAHNAACSVKLPDNLRDHVNQSKRFFANGKVIHSEFDKKFIKQHSTWPKMIFVKEGLKLFLQEPIKAVAYVLVTLYVILRYKLGKSKSNSVWTVSKSSKVLRG